MTHDSTSIAIALLNERIANYSAMRDECVDTGRDENGYALATEALERVLADLLAAAPSTSVREEETIRQVARKIEAALCIDGERTPGSMWASERGREQMMICARVAVAALVPSTDEGKRHG